MNEMNIARVDLRLVYKRAASADEAFALVQQESSVLGAAWHGARVASLADRSIAAVAMPPLDADPGVLEIWQASGPFKNGQLGSLHYRHDDDFLFAHAVIDESEIDIRGAAERAYADLFALLQREKFPHLLRCWNYLARINENQLAGDVSLERYRLFNIGRYAAFEDAARSPTAGAPAACALGTAQGPLVMYCIAARRPAQNIENPRQLSAYRYPQRYGPRSPSFSRASVWPSDSGPIFFVSGTASIVGHESLHIGDVSLQTEESVRNISVLVDEANKRLERPVFELSRLRYKVFIRHANDYQAVAQIMRREVGDAETIYLHADVCRAELLVEVEAVGFSN